MLFVTNRKINESPETTSLPRKISFDKSGTDRGIVGVDLYFGERLDKKKYQEIGSEALLQAVENAAQDLPDYAQKKLMEQARRAGF